MAGTSLRILIAALGSYGDIHPFLALGRTLQGRGHEVRLLAPAMYEALAGSVGLQFVPIGTVEQFEYHSSKADLWHPLRGFQVMAEGISELLEPYYRAIVENQDSGRTILVLSSLVFGGRIAQEVLRLPAVSVHLSPTILRSIENPPKTPPLPVAAWLPKWWNRLAYVAIDRLVMDRALAGPVNNFRASHGLPPVKRIFRDWVHSPDRVIGMFPDWFAPPQKDWPPQTVLTGFPLYDEADVTPMDDDLMRFLNEGEPPIAFTPGSAMQHGGYFFSAAIEACQLIGCRGLLVSRHSEHLPPNLPATIRHVSYAPFSQLLPRCAALVHHGGIGTASQALAAGVPQLVVPMAHDQADNAARLHHLGVAEVIPIGRLSGPAAATALKTATDPTHRAACVSIKERFAGENPLIETAEWIEQTYQAKKC